MKRKTGFSVLLSVGLIAAMVTTCFAAEDTSSESIAAETSTESVAETSSESETETSSSEAGDEQVTAESLIDRHLGKSEGDIFATADEKAAISMKMAFFGESMSIDMNMLFHVEIAKEIGHMTGEMHMAQESSSSEEENEKEDLETEIYTVTNDDGTVTVYTRDMDYGYWTRSEMDDAQFNMNLADLVKGDGFVLSEDTVFINGKECYEVKGKMAFDDMTEVVGNAMEDLDDIFPIGEGADAGAYKLDVFYYFDVESQDMVSLKMDGSAAMENLFKDYLVKSFSEMGGGMSGGDADEPEMIQELEEEAEAAEAENADTAEAGTEEPGFDVDALMALFQIEVPEFTIEVSNIEFGKPESIEIPEEVLSGIGTAENPGEEEENGEAGNGEDPASGSGNTGTAGDADAAVVFDGMTAIDNEECAITLEKIVPDDEWGYAIHAELENKSSDRKLMFSIENAYVNGVENDPFFAAEVAPGKKAKEIIYFENMDEIGITDFTDIEMLFEVYDSEDWSADDVARETVHVYPHGEEGVEPFVYEPADTDQILYDDDQISVIFTGVNTEDSWGYILNLFLVNKTDKTVGIRTEDVSVNGYMADPYFGHVLSAGKSAFTEIAWSYSELEEKGITDVEEIEFTLIANDEDDWEAEDLVQQLITLTV